MRRIVAVLFTLVLTGASHAQSLQPRTGDPLPGLTPEQRTRFFQGRQAFGALFTETQGRGPAFNGSSCVGCHNDPLIGGSSPQIVDRVGAVLPDGTYSDLVEFGGPVLQNQAILKGCEEGFPFEANAYTIRRTPPLFGLGLMEAVADQTLLDLEALQSSGVISGRANRVTAIEDGPGGPIRVGRFGFKSGVATVLHFSGDAAINEMGMTNRLFPNETAPNGNVKQLEMCDTVPDPEDIEVDGIGFIDRITDFQRYLAAPPQTPRSGMTGEALFVQIGCADCHVPELTTGAPPGLEAALANKTFRPYSDFLVHDMGENGEFMIEQGLAIGGEMRTTPLWGLRWNVAIWHDGRFASSDFATRMLDPEFGAIVQHAAPGSESLASAQAFAALDETQQAQIVNFLGSLGRAEYDADGNNVVNLADLADMASCFTGPGAFYTADDACAVHDLDQDGDVDRDDLAGLVLALMVAQPDCDGDGTGDLDAILAGAPDVNLDLIPDTCQSLSPCPGDCDGSGGVDFDDLICVLFSFGTGDTAADCDGSATVDFNDLVCGLFNYGPCG